MEQSGLTIGAFSGHFTSKEELVREALAFALEQQFDSMRATLGNSGIEGWIDDYLSEEHANNPHVGCPSAAMLPEIGRLPECTKLAYKQGLMRTTESLRDHLPKGSTIAPEESVALFSLMVGTVQIARAMPDAESAKKVLHAGMSAARLLMGLAASPNAKGRFETPSVAQTGTTAS